MAQIDQDRLKIVAEEEMKEKEIRQGVLGEMFSEDDIKEAFSIFDLDGDNYINAQEIRAILAAIGEGAEDCVIDEMIHMFDSNGDGQVGYNEFFCKIAGLVHL
jgi:Ca2+-binding EF-hand superfamily protein